MFEMVDNEKIQKKEIGAKIRVIGVGGGGGNAVNTMIKAGLQGVEYVVANTDAQALEAGLAPTKVQLGAEITKGLGAGANPEVGRKSALEEYEKLSEVLEGSDMVFITAGMGGGTGTGAAPVIAKMCKEMGVLTVGVVTKPFLFEGKKRYKQAEAGIQILEESVDSLITIPNQRLLHIAGDGLSLVDTFKKADDVLLNAVQGISDLITHTGLVNSDFADVHTIMSNKGMALMGTGVASGADRAIKAATDAISSPLLEDVTIDGATGVIINITGGQSLTAYETNEAMTLIMEAADEDAEIIFGTVIDQDLDESVKVTVIATGLGGQRVEKEILRPQERQAAPSPQKEREREPYLEARPSSDHKNQMVRAQESSEGQFQRGVAPSSYEQSAPEERFQDQGRETQSSLSQGDPEKDSQLARSIKEAASRYQQEKSPQEEQRQGSERSTEPESKKEESPHLSNGRARSIAERLGFMNFDEDELDTPTYLRRPTYSSDRPTDN